MTYVSWAAFYEGVTDQAYFNLLIPRTMEEIILRDGVRHATVPPFPAVQFQRASVEKVAREVCRAIDAFHLVFIHADTGGRALETSLERRAYAYCEAIQAFCNLAPSRCITISPRHETEAWVLADPKAVLSALGYTGSPESVGLPCDAGQAEQLKSPKETLASAVKQIRGKRRPFTATQIFPAIAQRQDLTALRRSKSFASFEQNLIRALGELGCVPKTRVD